MTTLYTKLGCVQCDALKRALDRKGVSFETVDISVDQRAYDYIVGLGYRQVPVVIGASVQFSGFRPDPVKSL